MYSQLNNENLSIYDDDKKEDHKIHEYDCNICLEIANEPIITTCGHLFCWPCFY